MTQPKSPVSKRLLRAVEAEVLELSRRREKLLHTREQLQDELDRIEQAIDDVSQRQSLLSRLADVDLSAPEESSADVDAPEFRADQDELSLRGPEIRRAALEVLLGLPARPQALHYREWYDEVLRAGYRISGKNPLAVFLTQLNRSPVVRKGSQAGVYELDRTAPRRLRRELEELQRQLRDVAAESGYDREEVRQRRHRLTIEIGRVEKSLEEADEVLRLPTDAAA